MTDPIGMAAGFGAGEAAGSSKAAHAATMAAIDGQRHQLEKMILVKRWQSYAAWLHMGVFAHKSEKKIVIDELQRVDPSNNVAKKASNGGYAQEIFSAIHSDPVKTEEYLNLAQRHIDEVVS